MDNKRKIFIKQFLNFNYIGVLTTGLGFIVYIIMLKIEFSYIPALTGDYVFGIVFSYFMNKKYTFSVIFNNDFLPLLKTTSVYLVSYVLNIFLLYLAYKIYGFNLIMSQAMIILLLAVGNFFMFKFFVFRSNDG